MYINQYILIATDVRMVAYVSQICVVPKTPLPHNLKDMLTCFPQSHWSHDRVWKLSLHEFAKVGFQQSVSDQENQTLQHR